ncbi:hypothetical protein M9Y10_032095 [Tritrichomonas musculus]|uniref:Uncharacterized protein n=1 Tax=Tritrichomonas musculus TaxID=1915356 RepID=A0ABR2GYZ5_9EUKA
MEMYKLIFLISKLQKFNYSITFICSDGETGLTKYHTAYFEKYIYEYIPKLLSQNLDESITVCDMINLIFHKIPNRPPMPSFDVLNRCKSARTDKWFSFLDKAVEPLSPDEIKMILDIGTTLDDLSTIGKMKDFYAINLFSLDNTINAYQSGNKQLFLYLLIYTLVLESFRNPIIEIETRKQIHL